MKIQTTLEKVNEGIKEIRKNGGSVRIKGSGGVVSVRGVTATFDFDQNSDILTVKITDKPWLVSVEYVEDKVKDYFK